MHFLHENGFFVDKQCNWKYFLHGNGVFVDKRANLRCFLHEKSVFVDKQCNLRCFLHEKSVFVENVQVVVRSSGPAGLLSASLAVVSLHAAGLSDILDYHGCHKASEDEADEDVGPCRGAVALYA